MKILLTLTFLFTMQLQAQNLKTYRWENRVVILFGDTSSKALIAQKSLLAKAEKELKERDIVVIKGNAAMEKELKQSSGFEGMILLGKDGGIKLKEPFEVKMETLFTLIDGMPMRRSEIRRKKKY